MHWIARFVIPWAFALIGLLVLANGVVMYRDVATLQQQARWLTHSRAVLDQVKLVRATFAAVEDEQPRAVVGAMGARRALLTQVEGLRRLTAADARQQRCLHALRRTLHAALQPSPASLDQSRPAPGGRPIPRPPVAASPARVVRASGHQRTVDGAVQRLLDTMIAEEKRVLSTRLAGVQAAGQESVSRLVVATVVTLVAVAALAWLVQGIAARRRREREVLQETNRRMEEFLSIASHELRSPLTTVKGNVQIARACLTALAARPELDTELQATLASVVRMLDAADGRSSHIARLVTDLLDASRAQSGHLELRCEACDLMALAHGVAEEHRAAWPERAIIIEAPTAGVTAWGDAARIAQVLTNYLTNALKYSGADTPVTIALTQTRDHAHVAVRDRGPGLSDGEQARIWDRFHRARGVVVGDGAGAGTAGGGLGLGLYICRQVIAAHRGEVGVESTPGQGSTFWFTLPLRTATATVAGSTAAVKVLAHA